MSSADFETKKRKCMEYISKMHNLDKKDDKLSFFRPWILKAFEDGKQWNLIKGVRVFLIYAVCTIKTKKNSSDAPLNISDIILINSEFVRSINLEHEKNGKDSNTNNKKRKIFLMSVKRADKKDLDIKDIKFFNDNYCSYHDSEQYDDCEGNARFHIYDYKMENIFDESISLFNKYILKINVDFFSKNGKKFPLVSNSIKRYMD